jgi:hypothetical protein
MSKKTDPSDRIDEALLEMALDFRGSLVSEATANKIIKCTLSVIKSNGIDEVSLDEVERSVI